MIIDSNADGPLVAVFGGAGYIGSVLTRLLLEKGYRVRVVDNFQFGPGGVEDLSSPALEVINADICDTNSVSHAVGDAESVILLSAIVGHRAQDIRWNCTRNINFLASSVVLDAAIEHGVSRFIFAGTNSVYGIQRGVMYETTIPEPMSLYSRLKLRMEERVINAKSRNFHPTSLRIATCHGYSPRMRFDLVANSLMLDAVRKKRIKVESGEQWRSLIHVSDAARAFVTCLESHVNMISGEIFNVGNSEQNLRVNEIVKVVHSLVPETEVDFVEAEPDLVDYRLSSSKLEKLLNFQANIGLEESLLEIRSLLQSDSIEDPFSLRYHNT